MGVSLLLAFLAIGNAMPQDANEPAPVYYPPQGLPVDEHEDSITYWALPSVTGQDDENGTVAMERLYGPINTVQALTLAYGPDFTRVPGLQVFSEEEDQDQMMREEEEMFMEEEEEEEDHRIIGGFYAKPGQFPFIVRLGNL